MVSLFQYFDTVGWPMFIIVIVISLEHCTGVRRYWFVQVQVLVFYAFCFYKV